MKIKIKHLIIIFTVIASSFLSTKAEDLPSLVELAPCALNSSKTETLVTRIDVGLQPLQITLNPITEKIYVTNFADNTVSVLDSKSNTSLTNISVGKGPNGISVNSKTNKIYVANQLDNTVTVIDGSTDTAITLISVGQRPVHVSLNEDTNKIYVSNQDSNTISIIDGESNTVVNEIVVGTKPQGIAINTKTNKIYVANTESNNISIIDGTSNAVINTLENIITNPTDLAIDENKNIIYTFTTSGDPLLGRGALYIIDGATDTISQGIIIGSNGTDIAFHKTSGKVYITHTFNSTIDGYNVKKDELLCLLTEFFDPTGIAVDPQTNLIYICETSTSKVAIIKDTGIKNDDDKNEPEKPKDPEDPENPNNNTTINPELISDFNVALEELSNIQNKIKNSTKFAKPVAARISSTIKKIKRAIELNPLACKNQTQITTEKLQAVIPFFESKGCTEARSKRCIPTEIIDEFLPFYEEQLEIIKSVIETDDNENEIPDLCE